MTTDPDQSSTSSHNPEQGVKTPIYPIYDKTRAFMLALEGTPRVEYMAMRKTIWDLRGTTDANVDWSDPDTWIPERLSSHARHLAAHLWDASGKLVNPRHTLGHWLLANSYGLLAARRGEGLHITEEGRRFVEDPGGAVVRNIDRAEGLIKLLQLVSELGQAARKHLLGPCADYLEHHSKVRSDSAVKSYLAYRLRNLKARKLLSQSGHRYQITDAGLAYLEADAPNVVSVEDELRKLAKEQREEAREQIKAILLSIDPIAFEHLISALLEAMDYEDVEVTTPSGDGGVDVIGSINVGITSVREVVQVKRHQRTIQRKDLDALRGSLHRFNAVRGMIITTSSFAKGTREAAIERNVAPITLIDGDKLIDLLIEHQLGIKIKAVELLEVDEFALRALGQAEFDAEVSPESVTDD